MQGLGHPQRLLPSACCPGELGGQAEGSTGLQLGPKVLAWDPAPSWDPLSSGASAEDPGASVQRCPSMPVVSACTEHACVRGPAVKAQAATGRHTHCLFLGPFPGLGTGTLSGKWRESIKFPKPSRQKPRPVLPSLPLCLPILLRIQHVPGQALPWEPCSRSSPAPWTGTHFLPHTPAV